MRLDMGIQQALHVMDHDIEAELQEVISWEWNSADENA